ncbi:MAG TPA: peptidylprolyl isomerase [Solirubrobacteraceae bacterium]
MSSKPSGGAANAGRHSQSGHCHTVSTPPPKGSQHIAKPALKLDPSKRYVVNLYTNCGTIEIQLAVKQAPLISASFAYLVEHRFYDDLTFHRVVSGFVIQGGDPDGNGSGGPGYTVVEKPPANLQYTRGVVAMAKTTADPAGASGSQFFIVTGANVGLPAQYALLGNVVGGENTIRTISSVPTEAGPDGEGSTPSKPIVIAHATLSES